MKPTVTALLLLIYAASFAQCPTYTTATNYDTFTYCGGDEMPPFDTFTPCGAQAYYSTIAFTATEQPTQISVTSAMNYTFSPVGVNIFAHIWIFDGCNGQPVWTTIGGACAVGADLLISGVVPAQNYDISLNIPSGEYIALFGYIGNPSNQEQIFGCVEISIGAPYFLELPDDEPRQSRDHFGNYEPRYTKVVIEGRGVFIRDRHTGNLYDIVTRKARVNQ